MQHDAPQPLDHPAAAQRVLHRRGVALSADAIRRALHDLAPERARAWVLPDAASPRALVHATYRDLAFAGLDNPVAWWSDACGAADDARDALAALVAHVSARSPSVLLTAPDSPLIPETGATVLGRLALWVKPLNPAARSAARGGLGRALGRVAGPVDVLLNGAQTLRRPELPSGLTDAPPQLDSDASDDLKALLEMLQAACAGFVAPQWTAAHLRVRLTASLGDQPRRVLVARRDGAPVAAAPVAMLLDHDGERACALLDLVCAPSGRRALAALVEQATHYARRQRAARLVALEPRSERVAELLRGAGYRPAPGRALQLTVCTGTQPSTLHDVAHSLDRWRVSLLDWERA